MVNITNAAFNWHTLTSQRIQSVWAHEETVTFVELAHETNLNILDGKQQSNTVNLPAASSIAVV